MAGNVARIFEGGIGPHKMWEQLRIQFPLFSDFQTSDQAIYQKLKSVPTEGIEVCLFPSPLHIFIRCDVEARQISVKATETDNWPHAEECYEDNKRRRPGFRYRLDQISIISFIRFEKLSGNSKKQSRNFPSIQVDHIDDREYKHINIQKREGNQEHIKIAIISSSDTISDLKE